MKYLFIIFSLLFTSACQPGETVNASQLNENYQARAVRSAGNIIGVRADNSADNLIFNSAFEPVKILRSGKIEIDTGYYEYIHYVEPDCTGDRYIVFSDYPFPEDKFLFGPLKGKIFRDQSTDELYYYPPDVQTMHAKIPLSYRHYFGCQSLIQTCANGYRRRIENGQMICDNGNLGNFAYTNEFRAATQEEINIYLSRILIKLLPNDPAITGLPNTVFPLPITFDGKNEAVIIEE